MSGIIASFYREYKIRMSSSRVFVENIANPIFTLLIFGLTLGNAIGSIDYGTGNYIHYLDYFVIGAINISLISNALVSATKMFLDKYVGLYEEMLSYPVKRSYILLGKLCFNLLISLTQALFMIFFVSVITGFRNLDLYRIISMFVLLTLGSSTWFFCMIFLSIKLKTQDSFNTVYYIIMTPVIFTSSIYYPVEKMPVILRFFGYINPLSWLTDIGRYIYLDIPTHYFILKILGLTIMLISSFILSVRLFSEGIK